MYDTNEKIHVNDFRTLKVWQKSVSLSKKIYKIVEGFPKVEEYGMKSQIIRCSTSISANISEGNSQLYPKKEYNFANNALGSAGETKNWIEMAHELNYIDNDIYIKLIRDTDEVIKMLIGYLKLIKRKIIE